MTRRAVLEALLVLAWIGAVAAGLARVEIHAQTPGPAGAAPARWPEASRFAIEPCRPRLLVFAHPQCPCTRASLNELARLLARAGDASRVATTVAFFRPDDAPADWLATDTVADAGAIPGVTVATDERGVEAARFGAKTSGHAVLYSADGRLLYAGGLTPARGHEGDSFGSEALAALLVSGSSSPSPATAPVFGCEIFGR